MNASRVPVSIRPRQQAQSLGAICDIRVEPASDGGVLVRLLAMPPAAFAPRAISDQSAILTVECETATAVAGVLELVTGEAPRGLWFDYRFRPVSHGTLDGVVFSGRCHWSNVRTVRIVASPDERLFENPFFRQT